MHFPNLDMVAVNATFAQLKPGRLHRDGSRYLPLIVLQLPDGTRLGVTDRHHRVNPDDVGQAGTARLIFQLSRLRIQAAGQHRRTIIARAHEQGSITTMPAAFGQIIAIPTWEQHRKLGYESLYTELLIDIGIGTVGLRTTVTGDNLAAIIGVARLHVGDWVELDNSRIDILAFNQPPTP